MKSGDRVVWSVFGVTKHGIVKRILKQKARVIVDGVSQEETFHVSTLRCETDHDIKERDYREAMRSWRDARPRTTHVHVDQSFHGEVTGQVVCTLRSPEAMREAARELELLAGWFGARP